MFPLLCYNQSLLFQNKKEEQHGLSVSTSQFSTYEDNRCLNILKNTKQYNYESSPWDMEYGTSAFMKISLTHLPFMKLLPKKQSLENVFPSIQRGGWHVREETWYEAIHQVKHSLIHSPFINDFYFLINSHPLQYYFHSNSGCVQYSLRHSLQQPSLSFPEPSLLQ